MADVNVANAPSLWKALCLKKSPVWPIQTVSEHVDENTASPMRSRSRGGCGTGWKSNKNLLWKPRARRRSLSLSSLATSPPQPALSGNLMANAASHPEGSFFYRFSRLCCRTQETASDQGFSGSPDRDPFESPASSPAGVTSRTTVVVGPVGSSRIATTWSCDSGCCDTGIFSPPPELDEVCLPTMTRFQIPPSVVISDFSGMNTSSGFLGLSAMLDKKPLEEIQPVWYDIGGGSRRGSLGLPGSGGLTLEDVENHRANRRLSDCSTCSSVSTLDVDCPSPGITRSFFDAGPGLGIGIDILRVTGLNNCPSKSNLEEDVGIELREERKMDAAIGQLPELREKETAAAGDVTLTSTSCSTAKTATAAVGAAEAHSRILDGGSTVVASQDGNRDRRKEEPDQGIPPRVAKVSGWKKVRNVVQWTPFIQTYRRQRYPWVQLSGHQGNFKTGKEQGTILKKLCSKEELCFKDLMQDPLKPFVPHYRGQVTADDGEKFLALEDLLSAFVNPCVMDCKLGTRTYLEEEIAKAKDKPKLRKDMYEKMVTLDSSAPTAEEHRLQGVTKPRYMLWRETLSSTATFGFRIEGIRKSDGSSSNDFKTTRSSEQLNKAFQDFVQGFPHALDMYLERLQNLKETLQMSPFFATRELIGSSLLFIHDSTHANIWMIDFAKTLPLPEGFTIDHKQAWHFGNHEDGYLTGLHNIITLLQQINQNES